MNIALVLVPVVIRRLYCFSKKKKFNFKIKLFKLTNQKQKITIMKTKIFFTALCLMAIIFESNAQLKVLTSGRVEVRNQAAIYSNSANPGGDGLDVLGSIPSISNGLDLIWGYYYNTQTNNPGLLTMQSADGAYFSVRANGYVGIFNSNPSCALEVGTAGQSQQIKVNGSVVLTSDERLKDNVKDLSNSFNLLKQLRTVTYNYKMPVIVQKTKINSATDSTVTKKPQFVPKPDTSGRIHYGFLAQDVQKTFPDLVYKDSAGMFSVDYIGMIPLLVDALRDQKAQLDAQAKQIDYLMSIVAPTNSGPKKADAVITTGLSETNTLTYPVLDQNTPNPFNQSTTIGYYLPTTINMAAIYVYDMNGVQLKSYNISDRGKKNIIINGSEFNAGMYLYALIADGKVIDTKRMILTK